MERVLKIVSDKCDEIFRPNEVKIPSQQLEKTLTILIDMGGSTVGWGTQLQAEMSVSIPDGVIDVFLPATLWSSDRFSVYHKWTATFRGGWGKGGLGVGLTIVLSDFDDCLEIWEPKLLERFEPLIRRYRYC